MIRVKEVTPLSNYQLLVSFSNGAKKYFDVKPYLDKGIFKELKNIDLFNSVHVFLGSIAWDNGADFCPDTLFEEGGYYIPETPSNKVAES